MASEVIFDSEVLPIGKVGKLNFTCAIAQTSLLATSLSRKRKLHHSLPLCTTTVFGASFLSNIRLVQNWYKSTYCKYSQQKDIYK